jgi:hypothetical protein
MPGSCPHLQLVAVEKIASKNQPRVTGVTWGVPPKGGVPLCATADVTASGGVTGVTFGSCHGCHACHGYARHSHSSPFQAAVLNPCFGQADRALFRACRIVAVALSPSVFGGGVAAAEFGAHLLDGDCPHGLAGTAHLHVAAMSQQHLVERTLEGDYRERVLGRRLTGRGRRLVQLRFDNAGAERVTVLVRAELDCG